MPNDGAPGVPKLDACEDRQQQLGRFDLPEQHHQSKRRRTEQEDCRQRQCRQIHDEVDLGQGVCGLLVAAPSGLEDGEYGVVVGWIATASVEVDGLDFAHFPVAAIENPVDATAFGLPDPSGRGGRGA